MTSSMSNRRSSTTLDSAALMPMPVAARQQRGPHELADPERQDGARAEADRRRRERGIERHVAERAEQHAPALRPDVDAAQADARPWPPPTRAARPRAPAHLRPVGPARREVQTRRARRRCRGVRRSALRRRSSHGAGVGRAALSLARRRDESVVGAARARSRARAAGERPPRGAEPGEAAARACRGEAEAEHRAGETRAAPGAIRARHPGASRERRAAACRARSSAVQVDSAASTTTARREHDVRRPRRRTGTRDARPDRRSSAPKPRMT